MAIISKMFTFASLTFIDMKKILFCMLMLLSAVGYAQNQEIRLFSHRGGRLEFDENTMSAFKASYDAGYRGFEIDVRLTKDGEMVLFHDNSLDRCTDSTGPLEDLTFKEAMQVRTKKGNKLCTLDEFLDFIKDSHDMDVYVDLWIDTSDLGGDDPYVEIINGTVNFNGVGTYQTKDNLIQDENYKYTGVENPIIVKIAKNQKSDGGY